MSKANPEVKTTDPAILFIRPNAISRADKKKLEQAGVLIVEIENPADAKFVRAHAEIESTEMLGLAAKAINGAKYADEGRVAFAIALCASLMQKANIS